MKVAVSAQGENLEAQIDPRFGRCQYFLIVDTESMDFQSLVNESAMATGGAGIQAAQTVARLGVKAIITGHVGPNAYQTLSASGIEVLIGASGKVSDAIELFKNGELQRADSPSVGGHFGMGGGMGRGRGRGMGR